MTPDELIEYRRRIIAGEEPREIVNSIPDDVTDIWRLAGASVLMDEYLFRIGEIGA